MELIIIIVCVIAGTGIGHLVARMLGVSFTS